MAKQRKLSAEHKQKISSAMKARHAGMKKGVASGDFGAQAAEYNMSYAGLQSISKSMGPDQAYQLSIDIRSAITAISSNIAKMEIEEEKVIQAESEFKESDFGAHD